MKKILITTLLLYLHTISYAQSEVLTIYKTDGQRVQHSFLENPVIKFEADSIRITTKNIEVTYPVDIVQKYTVNESKDSVDLRSIIINNDELTSYENTTDIEDCNLTYIRTFVSTR